MALFLPRRWRKQPQYPVEVDTSNSLAAGLQALVHVVAGVGPVDVCSGRIFNVRAGTLATTPTDIGVLANTSGANNSAWEDSVTTLRPTLGTIAWHGVKLAEDTTNGGIFELTHSSNSAASPYVAIGVKRYLGTTSVIFVSDNGGTVRNLSFDPGTVAIGTTETMVGRVESGAQHVTYASRSIRVSASGTVAGDLTYGSGPRLVIGEDYRAGTRNGGRALGVGAIWGRYILDAEVEEFIVNPWQLFAPLHTRRYFFAAGGDTTVTPGVGEVVVTGLSPTVTATDLVTVAPTTGSVVITGLAPTLVTGTIVAPTTGEVVITGLAPIVTVSSAGNTTVTPDVGVVVVTGLDPTVTVSDLVTVAPGQGTVVVTGLAPTISVSVGNTTVVPGVGSAVVTGLAPTIAVTQNVVVEPGVGSIIIGGLAPDSIGGAATAGARPEAGGTGTAGKRRRFRRPVLVEIDGETFSVADADEALELLQKAREAATQAAPAVAKKALNKARDIERKTGELPALEVPTPTISADEWASAELKKMLEQAQADINAAYMQAARDAEIALLARRAYYAQDEEDALAVLLLV